MIPLGTPRFPFYAFFLMNSAFPSLPTDRPVRVGVLVLDDTNLLSLAAAVDPMRAANRFAGRRVFDWTYLTMTGSPARITAGFDIPGAAVGTVPVPDLLMLVASFSLDRQDTPALHRELRRMARGRAVIVAVDGAGWLLASAGLLDGQAATTHWEDLDRFAARFPRVETVRDRFRVSGRMLTTGGASPCLDMMLALIRHHAGADVAARVAGVFIYDPVHAGDAPQRLVPTLALSRRAPIVARAIAEMEAGLDAPVTMDQLSAQLGVSRRLLEQKFRATLGQSPHGYWLGLPLAEAPRLARDTDMAVQDIALACGFSSHAAFGRAFKAAYGTSVRDIRRLRGNWP